MSTSSRAKLPRSGCPIATSLDQIGDRWSLVVIRDLVNGKSRFNEFLESPERITTSVLADRLEALEQHGLVQRAQYKERPARYEYKLTPKGLGLLAVLQEFCRWANRYMPDTWRPPAAFMQRRVP
jgi:DNA-binding HxlR family transcriptional regulator